MYKTFLLYRRCKKSFSVQIGELFLNFFKNTENHPFKERNGIEQEELLESIKENGLLEMIIVCFFLPGTYEIISVHRRVSACKELGIKTVPAIDREMSKDDAIIAMVDSNLQREDLLPSEKAFA